MQYTIEDLKAYMDTIDLTKKGQKDRMSLFNRIVKSMEDNGIKDLKSREDVANLGQLIEGLIKAVKKGYEHGYYSQCNASDFTDGNGAWEIKVSSSPNSLATPFSTPKRVMFVTPKGIAVLSKATIANLMETCDKNYVQVRPEGIKLKISAVELGKPVKWLNEVLGF